MYSSSTSQQYNMCVQPSATAARAASYDSEGTKAWVSLEHSLLMFALSTEKIEREHHKLLQSPLASKLSPSCTCKRREKAVRNMCLSKAANRRSNGGDAHTRHFKSQVQTDNQQSFVWFHQINMLQTTRAFPSALTQQSNHAQTQTRQLMVPGFSLLTSW